MTPSKRDRAGTRSRLSQPSIGLAYDLVKRAKRWFAPAFAAPSRLNAHLSDVLDYSLPRCLYAMRADHACVDTWRAG